MTRFLVASLAALAFASQSPAPTRHRCDWTPPQTDREVVVGSTRELVRAVARAVPRTTVLLEDGEYRLDDPLDITAPGTVLRGQSGDRSRVVIRGDGMRGRLGVALSVSAADVTISDLTIRDVAQHGIQIRGERQASRVVVHNVHIVDAGQQLLKGSVGSGPPYADEGVIACSRFEYRDTAPSDYTDGIDLIAVQGWTIRDNEFRNIRGPQDLGYRAGPAILVWGSSRDTVVERNVIVDSYRGIAIGLVAGTATYARDGNREFDHRGGLVRNNVICNQFPWADEAIEASASVEYRIEHNTVLTAGRGTDWSIGIRFPASTGIVRNNLTSTRVQLRDGASAEEQGNISSAQPEWFVNPGVCDLHLTPAAAAAIDSAVPTGEGRLDFDGQAPAGPPDVGAFEFKGLGRSATGSRQ